MLVTAEPVSLRPLKRTIQAVGTLHGFEEIVVSSNVEGRVLRILHDVSERIQPNELLVELDPTDIHLEIHQLESDLEVELAKLGLDSPEDHGFDVTQLPAVRFAHEKRELTRLKMQRMQTLKSKQVVTAEEAETATTDFKTAEAEYDSQVLMARSSVALIKSRRAALEIARQKLRNAQVKSPIPQRTAPHAGNRPPYVMTQRSVAEGTFVRIGDEICRLVIDDTLVLKALLPEQYSPDVQVGLSSEVLPSASRQAVPGLVTKINPAVDPSTRTFQVEIQVANAHSTLKPGGFAQGIIEIRQEPEARTVPLDAMVQYAGVTKLFVVDGEQAREIPFVPGVQTAEWVEVVEPALSREAVVITSGHTLLANGAQIVVRNPQRQGNGLASAPSDRSIQR